MSPPVAGVSRQVDAVDRSNPVAVSADADYLHPETGQCPAHGGEVLKFRASGGWNNFEGVCVVEEGGTSMYYAIKEAQSTQPIDMLYAVVDLLQAWWCPAEGGWRMCQEEGRYPVQLPH